MTIGTNNFFPPASLASLPTSGLTIWFDASFVLGTIFVFAPTTFTSYIIPVVINPQTIFYSKKTVMVEDLTSLKLYIKEIIWIGGILFSNITKA